MIREACASHREVEGACWAFYLQAPCLILVPKKTGITSNFLMSLCRRRSRGKRRMPLRTLLTVERMRASSLPALILKVFSLRLSPHSRLVFQDTY